MTRLVLSTDIRRCACRALTLLLVTSISTVDLLASTAQLPVSARIKQPVDQRGNAAAPDTHDRTLAQPSAPRVVQCTEIKQFSSYKSAKVLRELINPRTQLSDSFTRSQSRATLLPEYLAELSHSPLAKLRL